MKRCTTCEAFISAVPRDLKSEMAEVFTCSEGEFTDYQPLDTQDWIELINHAEACPKFKRKPG